jgi:Tripartite tricarboxylate transporter family receptor
LLGVSMKNLSEFIAYAKANPNKLNMATSGAGGGSDLYGQLFKVMTAVDLVTVHYRGVGPGLPDLMSGRVEVMFLPVASAIGYIRAGKLRPLGVTTTTRREVLPDVPAIGDFVPGYEATNWEGIGAPANTPPDIIAILNKQVNAALADTTFKGRLVDLGGEPFASSPTDFGKFIVEYLPLREFGEANVRFGSEADISRGQTDVPPLSHHLMVAIIPKMRWYVRSSIPRGLIGTVPPAPHLSRARNFSTRRAERSHRWPIVDWSVMPAHLRQLKNQMRSYAHPAYRTRAGRWHWGHVNMRYRPPKCAFRQ